MKSLYCLVVILAFASLAQAMLIVPYLQKVEDYQELEEPKTTLKTTEPQTTTSKTEEPNEVTVQETPFQKMSKIVEELITSQPWQSLTTDEQKKTIARFFIAMKSPSPKFIPNRG